MDEHIEWAKNLTDPRIGSLSQIYKTLRAMAIMLDDLNTRLEALE